jgi:hypothetical protein
MSETIGTILVDEGKITLKPFEGKEETWEEWRISGENDTKIDK